MKKLSLRPVALQQLLLFVNITCYVNFRYYFTSSLDSIVVHDHCCSSSSSEGEDGRLPVVPFYVICERCGQLVLEEARRCPNCGARIEGVLLEESSRTTYYIIAAAFVGLVLLVVVVVFLVVTAAS